MKKVLSFLLVAVVLAAWQFLRLLLIRQIQPCLRIISPTILERTHPFAQKRTRPPIFIKNDTSVNITCYANGVEEDTTPTNPLYNAGHTGWQGYSRAVVPPGRYLVRSIINEAGYSKASLNLSCSVNGETTFLSGWWSPDSTGSYPDATYG